MKDVVLYVFFLGVYGVLGLQAFSVYVPLEAQLSWRVLGLYTALFTAVATVARWTVVALKKRERLPKGQKIVGIEEEVAPHVIDVLQPVVVSTEKKKPRMAKKRRL
ncbi:MAG: hypothetical protein LDLANPLL_01863 [Turneriella sp.]|nr:hypothetical protein [Turneriella sp.]